MTEVGDDNTLCSDENQTSQNSSLGRCPDSLLKMGTSQADATQALSDPYLSPSFHRPRALSMSAGLVSGMLGPHDHLGLPHHSTLVVVLTIAVSELEQHRSLDQVNSHALSMSLILVPEIDIFHPVRLDPEAV